MDSRNEEVPLADEIRHREDRLRIYEALVRMAEDPRAVLDVWLAAHDSAAARAALRRRYGFDDVQATAVMDMQFRRLTYVDRQRIRDTHQEERKHLAALRAAQDDSAQ